MNESSGPDPKHTHGGTWHNADLASHYLSGVASAIPLRGEQIEVMIRLIEGFEITPHKILDLGCGDGLLGAAILGRYPQAHGTFVDFSDTMLTAARDRMKGSPSEFEIIAADYGKPGWPKKFSERGPFDVIVSGFSIHHQPDDGKRRVYGKIFQLLTSGGVFLNNEHVLSPTKKLESIWDDLLVDALYDHDRSTGGDQTRAGIATHYAERPDRFDNILAPITDQCDWLRKIGFHDVDVYFKIFELAVFGGRKPK